MSRRLATLAVAVVASLALAGSSFAFDCIRVSSSLQGLKSSAKSGNWLVLDFSSAAGTQETFATVIEQEITPAQATC